MNFIHQPYQPHETIAAIATPPGEGGIAIIRISGKRSIEIAEKIFSGPVWKYKSHTAHFGTIRNAHDEHIDDVLLLTMLGQRSFTGEDTVEIHCHGGSLIARRVLETVLACGIRSALPGEFSFKAFINGKIDLAQAEAIQDLIGAKNEMALNAASEQLQGTLSKRITAFQKELTSIAAILEAWVDFPEEGLEFATMDDLCDALEAICLQLEKLTASFHDGRIVHEGLSICLVGCPNVGKSSLMNALLDKDRAIVSHIPGTTRDVVEDHVRLNGFNFKLIDTAGLRQSLDTIEQEGIRRSKEAMARADLVLLVLDASRDLNQAEELELIKVLPSKQSIVVWNKIDLSTHSTPEIDFPHVVALSAKERIGLEGLNAKIDQVVWQNGVPSREEILITNVRHKEAIAQAASSCRMVIKGLNEDVSPEFLALDMRQALAELGKIIGTNVSEDVLSSIFSQFCIGK